MAHGFSGDRPISIRSLPADYCKSGGKLRVIRSHGVHSAHLHPHTLLMRCTRLTRLMCHLNYIHPSTNMNWVWKTFTPKSKKHSISWMLT
ncbi:hypothetical protein RSOLAG1IB_07255 [Rhizoctonia solani AG-1 IB]|uniref:Uncharacterized protein n=1 Tax=Thanatephorus cucumeris (strain AG1-IB / isolate 7/3/14) TaxID=1108050 RepID=A0A0B7F9I1_THACB|nr:hypothetical protein RSOLAG1IB_07255 [Rhizoctonia solani AG-1 IB]